MKKFLCIVDSYSKDTQVERSLALLGLKNNEDYLIRSADGSSDQIMEGDPGERIVDSEVLLVFISSFQGLRHRSVALAEKIRKANPSAKIYFYSTIHVSLHELPPVFDGRLKKEFLKHSNLTAIIKETFGI